MKNLVVWYKTKCGVAIIIVVAITLIISIVSIILSGVALGKSNDNSSSSGIALVSDFQAIDAPTNFVYSSCGNFTPISDGTGSYYDDRAQVNYVCPKPLDKCNRNVCWQVDGVCHEQLALNSTCSSSFPCPKGKTCNIDSCQCEDDSNRQCTVDADCLKKMNNPICEQVSCQEGQCIIKTAHGQQCSNNGECSADQFCNSMCICVTSGAPSAVTYMPKIIQLEGFDEFDFSFITGSNFFYTDFSNYVEISFSFNAKGNFSSMSFQAGFDLSLPNQLEANVVGFSAGQASQAIGIPLKDLGLKKNMMTSTGILNIVNSNTARVLFFNQNPEFVSNNINVESRFSGWIKYQKMII